MAKVKISKQMKGKKNKKKHLKAKIIMSMIMLVLILVAGTGIGIYLYGEYKNSFYPENVVEPMNMSALARKMSSEKYLELYDIAMVMAQDGNGVLLTPVGRKRAFDYEADIMVRMSTSTGNGRIVVARGSGNIVDDIKKHAKEYAGFIGKVEPSYAEKVSESGMLSGYQAAYSCGIVTCGNILSEQSFYLVALEVAANDTERLFVVYTTEDYHELGTNLKVIEEFSLLALEGSGESLEEEQIEDSLKDEESPDLKDNASSEEEVMSIEEINDYISHTYPVQDINALEQVSDNSAIHTQEKSLELDLEYAD